MKELVDVQAVPLDAAFTEEELRDQFFKRGYQLAGQVLVRKGSQIATPDNPDGKQTAMPCNIWVTNVAMIPAPMLAEAILQSESKDMLCQKLFNMTLDQLEQEMMEEEK